VTYHLPVVFTTGAAVLIIEVLGTRVVAPVFGMTVYVWSALITVTLASLAVGYAAGGTLADRRTPAASLTGCLAAAAAWTFLIPAIRRPILLATAELGIHFGVLLAAAALFAPPLAALGAVGPLVIRLRTKALNHLGREIGGITALSTVGSVMGALAAGFILIPYLPVSGVLYAVAGILAVIAVYVAVREKVVLGRRSQRAGTAAVILLAAAWGSHLASSPVAAGLVREEGHSRYGEIKVVDRPRFGRRTMYIDGLPNTVLDLKNFDSLSDYITSFELLPLMRPAAKRSLLIGVGGGALIHRFHDHHGVSTDGVDVDAEVVRLAQRWFRLRPSGRLVVADGRRYIERAQESWDFIIIDAFNGDRHPLHLFSREALELMKKRLVPGGVLSLNVIGYAVGPRAGLRRAVEATLRAEFAHVKVLAANTDLDPRRSYVNLTFFASDVPLELQQNPLARRPILAAWYAQVKDQWLAPEEGGPIVTDDFNPIETLNAPAMLAIRKRLLELNPGVMAY
jgi:spermidine synthase